MRSELRKQENKRSTLYIGRIVKLPDDILSEWERMGENFLVVRLPRLNLVWGILFTSPLNS